MVSLLPKPLQPLGPPPALLPSAGLAGEAVGSGACRDSGASGRLGWQEGASQVPLLRARLGFGTYSG